MSNQGPDRWINAELRRIPLPEGLLERLRAIAQNSDEELDTVIRDVPVPAGLMGRLTQIVAAEKLDRQILDVPIPSDLVASLRAIPDDEALDEEIRQVPVPLPARVMRSITNIPRRTRRWQSLWHLATAASLLLMVSLSYFLTMFGLIHIAYRPAEDRVLVIRPGPPDRSIDLLAMVPEIEIPLELPEQEPARSLVEQPPPSVDFVAMRLDERPFFEEELTRLFGGKMMEDWRLVCWEPLGSPHFADDELPELLTVAGPRPAGVAAPLVPGYDLDFLCVKRAHPPVPLASGSPLASQTVPLATRTYTYDRAERAVAKQRMPDPREVRVEDFLAALDYHFPLPPPGELGIRTAAGPSVFGDGAPQLLQIGVQAGPPARRATKATYLTVGIDVSASMRWDGRADNVRQALRRLVRNLEPDDRMSLVRFDEQPYLDKEYLGPEERDELLTAIEWVRPGGGTNLAAGLQLAASVALRYPPESDVQPKLVIISDDASGVSKETGTDIERLLAEVSGQGVQFTAIDLSARDTEDPLLARLARAANGNILKARSTEDIQWALVETLTGNPSLVAADTILEVKFRPETVASYRLLGHVPAVAGMMPQSVQTSLRCRESATALFEVWLRPDGGDDVAVAELEWVDPVTGKTQRRQQRISRLQFAPSLAESALSLQAATVAARTAEVLSDSPFVISKSRGLRDVIALAREVNPRLASRPSFERFVAFVERAEHVRTYRGSVPR
jgi:Ca-activated chloride channel family protein